jgi:hypothetical protein
MTTSTAMARQSNLSQKVPAGPIRQIAFTRMGMEKILKNDNIPSKR